MALLAVVPIVAALSVVHADLGCSGTNVGVTDMADAAVVEVPGADGGVERDASRGETDGGKACVDPMVLEVKMAGSFTGNSDLVAPREPSVMASSTVPVDLGMPFLAAEFSIADLCSAEEVSPSYIRLVCLDLKGRRRTIEYRINSTDVVSLVDGSDRGQLAGRIPEAGCAKFETEIPKRDLTTLAKAYLDDSPSQRCAASKGPGRKVAAKLVRHLDADSIWNMPCSKSLCCYASTGVRLSILLVNVGPFQDMGRLHEQCFGPCNASRSMKPNRFSVHCTEGNNVEAYQLGDALYIAEDDHVRRVPLPCDVELDFQLKEFMATLSPGNISSD